MTEQELREKIARIIAKHLCKNRYSHFQLYGDSANCYSRENFAECESVCNAVDALIAAGIGDVKESKLESDHFWRMWQGALVELERAEHRAEVAEKAFKKYLEKEACRFCNYKKINYCEATKGTQEDCFNATIETYIEQAEKELQEERKDD